MKEDPSQSQMTPIYLLNLYSKWQRLDMLDTIKKFFLFRGPSGKNETLTYGGPHIENNYSDYLRRG